MKIKDLVLEKITRFPILRQDKRYLQAHIWLEQCRELEINSVEDFVVAYAQNRLINAETIRRSCMIQMNLHPELKPSQDVQNKNAQMEALMRERRGDL